MNNLERSFRPNQIAAVAAGYWWNRASSGYTGLGTAGFTITEQNGNTAKDRKQSTLAAQPVAANGYLRYPAGTGHDTTAAATQVGAATQWTHIVWFRFPNNITLTANRTVPIFTHYGAGGARRLFLNAGVNAGGNTRQIRGIYSTDGSEVFQYFWEPTFDTDWHCGIWEVDGTNPTATARMSFALGDGSSIVTQTPTVAPSGGASLFNANAVMESAANAALSVTTPDTIDLAQEYSFPGLLTAAQKLLVMGYGNPKV